MLDLQLYQKINNTQTFYVYIIYQLDRSNLIFMILCNWYSTTILFDFCISAVSEIIFPLLRFHRPPIKLVHG